MERKRAPRNRTLTLSKERLAQLGASLLHAEKPLCAGGVENKIFNDDSLKVLSCFPDGFVDLLILDPPYNRTKTFNGNVFSGTSDRNYTEYLESWFPQLLRLLKPEASVYLCGDWRCSAVMYEVLNAHLTVRNRIVWQREKGRGAENNWKNSCEDIWFATKSDRYTFNLSAVKQKRRVIAPYRQDGKPKDWDETADGKFRLTCPSNFWDDISVPYWSMPENTDHPTQKPEKLMAKLILASSNPGDLIFDPFLGSGTSAVAAKKLGRRFCGIERDPEYCCWALERLQYAEEDFSIQGYADGVFWERNSFPHIKHKITGEKHEGKYSGNAE